ncbi:MAG: WG repeat-containing protein [Clostridia bacterium]|nr:WG repeat-containing protein [Clostridia bacterium]
MRRVISIAMAVMIAFALLPAAQAGRMLYSGQDAYQSGALYPYWSPEGNCLVDPEGNVYAEDEDYLGISVIVSDGGERRFLATRAEDGEAHMYLLDEKGQPLTDGGCEYIFLAGDDILFQDSQGRYGAYGWDGEILIPAEYLSLYPVGDGSFFGFRDEYAYELSSSSAERIWPGEGSETVTLGSGDVTSISDFYDGLAEASVYVDGQSLCGYVDGSGRWAIVPQFTYASYFSGGYATVMLLGYEGLIDRQGRLLLPIKYDAVSMPYTDSPTVAAARKGDRLTVYDLSTMESLYEIEGVDYSWFGDCADVLIASCGDEVRAYTREGRLICTASDSVELTILSDDRYCSVDFSDMSFELRDFDGNLLMSDTGYIYPVYDGKGAVGFTLYQSETIESTYGHVGLDGRKAREGLYDLDGNEILPPKYDSIVPLCDGLYSVTRSPWHGVVDKSGEWIIKRSDFLTLQD